jgi:hypothetical protein
MVSSFGSPDVAGGLACEERGDADDGKVSARTSGPDGAKSRTGLPLGDRHDGQRDD